MPGRYIASRRVASNVVGSTWVGSTNGAEEEFVELVSCISNLVVQSVHNHKSWVIQGGSRPWWSQLRARLSVKISILRYVRNVENPMVVSQKVGICSWHRQQQEMVGMIRFTHAIHQVTCLRFDAWYVRILILFDRNVDRCLIPWRSQRFLLTTSLCLAAPQLLH